LFATSYGRAVSKGTSLEVLLIEADLRNVIGFITIVLGSQAVLQTRDACNVDFIGHIIRCHLKYVCAEKNPRVWKGKRKGGHWPGIERKVRPLWSGRAKSL
jgi:hypothetical protein